MLNAIRKAHQIFAAPDVAPPVKREPVPTDSPPPQRDKVTLSPAARQSLERSLGEERPSAPTSPDKECKRTRRHHKSKRRRGLRKGRRSWIRNQDGHGKGVDKNPGGGCQGCNPGGGQSDGNPRLEQ